MKVQLASDLHLEFLQRDCPREVLIQPHPEAEVLVLAGDIANGVQAMTLFKDWPVPVVYVCGNHELYGHPIDGELKKMKKACTGGMHLLENETLVIGDVRFLGCTLWTDYQLDKYRSPDSQMVAAKSLLNDHRLIRNGRYLFSPKHALARHQVSRKWLTEELEKPWPGKTVVVTHHGPHPLSIHPRYQNSALNAAFNSNLSKILMSESAPGLWLHGHVHDSFDYSVGKCRVVANPAGYILNPVTERRVVRNGEPYQPEFENPEFNRSLLLEI